MVMQACGSGVMSLVELGAASLLYRRTSYTL